MSGRSQLARLARGGAVNVAGSFVGGLAGIALVVVVTNGFARDLAGMLFAATSAFLIVTAISGLGTDAGLAHSIQRALAAGEPASARAIPRIALGPVLALAVPFSFAGWLAAPSLAGMLSADADPSAMTDMLRVLAVTLPIATAYDTLLATTRAYGTMRANVAVEKLGRLPGQILCVLVVWAFGLPPVWLAIAWAAPYVIGLVAVVWWYRKIVVTAEPDAVARPGLAKEFWSFTAPRALSRICQVALQRVDIVLVAALLSPGHAAIYTAATRFLTIGQLGTQAIQQVLQPQLARLFAEADLTNARPERLGERARAETRHSARHPRARAEPNATISSVFQTSTAWLMAMAWPVYLLSAVAAPVLLRIFGEGYDSGRWTLVILSLTMLVATACGPVDVALLMAGRSRQSLLNNAIALAVNLALNVLLIPVWGITGAAVAWSAALLLRNALPVLQVWRAYSLLAFGPAAGWVALSAAGCFGLVPLAVTLLWRDWLIVGLVGLPLLCLAYGWALWKGREPLGLTVFQPMVRSMVPYRMRVGLSRALLRRPGAVEVPLDRLLLGEQDGVPVRTYAEEFDDLWWGSTPVPDGPHAALLRLADAAGPDGLSDQAILDSPYGEHARRCLRLGGRYFWAKDEAGVVEVARAFLDRRQGSTCDGTPRSGQSGPDDPILVAPIRGSDCFQVLDGHHRLALAAYHDEPTANVSVKRGAVTTPLQDHLSRMSWLGGSKELYQPLNAPELRQEWTTVRQCTDRLEKLLAFLDERGIGPDGSSYLDVASCYGWFVAKLAEAGYTASGMERDPLAPQLGKAAYGLDPDRTRIGDAVELLRTAERDGERWDVVSCFSLLHHFVLGRGSTTADDLIRLLHSVTGSVIFLDTGQEHERWFQKSLAGWNPERVTAFVREHTDFGEIVDLGPDADAVGRYAGNYGRHLFACVRSSPQRK